MTDYRKNVICLTILFLASMVAFGNAAGPARHTVVSGTDQLAGVNYSAAEQTGLEGIARLTPGEAFESLKDTNLMVNDNSMKRSVYKAFGQRRQSAVDMALDKLRSPVLRRVGNETVNRHADFVVAKKILEAFPDEAASRLPGLYSGGDITTRINVLNASGMIANEGAIRDMLLKALDDRTFSDENDESEENQEDVAGMPLRICDVAYNQLVLRYGIKNALRTIGTVHAIDIRDYHIDILKDFLGNQQ